MRVVPPDIRVLHVDDDPEFAALTASYLERIDDGLDVVTETSAAAGLDRLAEGDVDCIVADYDMPDVDGLEFLRAVSDGHPDLSFILFTGKGSEEIASEAIAEGVTDYLQKGPGRDRFAVLANRIRNAVAHRRAEETVARTESRVTELAERTSDVLWMFDGDWETLLFVNSAYEDLWGRSRRALWADPTDFLEGVHPEDRAAVRESMERLSSGESMELEYRVDPTSDFGRWVWVHAEPIRGEDGGVARIAGFARDITDRKERERQLEALHDATRRLLAAETVEEVAEVTSDALADTLRYPFNVVRLHRDGQVVPVAVSDAIELGLGGQRPTYDVGEETAGLAYERGAPVVYDDVSSVDDDVDRGRTSSALYVPIGDHGVVTIADTEPAAFDDEDVHLAEVLMANVEAVLDLIEQRSALARQNERLDAFASVVSHDLRNPLTVAMGRLDLAREEVESEHLDDAAGALDRMNGLIEDVLTYARSGRSAADPAPVDLREAVDDAWLMVGDGGELVVEDDLGRLRADEGLLGQLLENLFRNAVDHGGPDVTVRVGRLDGDRVEADGAGAGGDDGADPPGPGFYVEDDGPGLPDDLGQSVFDPGVSTAPAGVGLGLSIVREIVDAHGWSVAARGADGGGTRIEVTGVSTAA